MAKEVILQISWLRPLKLIGLANLLCGIICFILAMSLNDWVVSDTEDQNDFYMSLFTSCQRRVSQDLISPSQNQTAPPPQEEEPSYDCAPATRLGTYVSVVQALIVIPFILAVIAFVIGIVAYCKREWRFLYKIAGIILIVGAVGVLVAVIVFPIVFLSKLPFNAFFWFWWAYGLAWAALCFILTAGILFLISQDRKEIYHKEKRMLI